MKAENRGNKGFLQRERVEHQGYAEAWSTDRSEGKERDGQATCWKRYWTGIT